MKAVCLIDTSVFCELVAVPFVADEPKAYEREFRKRAKAGEFFLLPMTTIIETGNHIGQNGGASQRREASMRFVRQVRAAIRGGQPFTTTPMPDPTELEGYLADFASWAARNDLKGKGSGLGDLTIYCQWEVQRALNPARRVYIWSKDGHLSSYDTGER